jgi:hypothetical protein
MLNPPWVALPQPGGRSVSSERVIKQIGLDEEVVHKLKMHALEKRKQMQEVTDQAMQEFFEQRDKVKEDKGRPPDYIVSPTNAKDFNVRLSKTVAKKLDKVANEDTATERRVIYTGLIAYARKHKLIPE